MSILLSSRNKQTKDELVMHKAGWKIDEHDKACYIDIDEDIEEQNTETDDQHCNSDWCNLPELILEQIFGYLSIRERYYASLVCRRWSAGFYMPTVWNNFIVDDHTLTRARYNYYSGWQYCLDHMRTQHCLSNIGRYLHGIEFRPWHSFNNLYQFMTLLSWSIDRAMEAEPAPEFYGIGQRIRKLVYYFPCNLAQPKDPDGVKLFGTGGQMLKGLKELLIRLPELRTLELVDFVLERYEANHLLDDVVCTSCTKMRRLNVVNATISHCPIMHVGLFLNLRELIIAPQNIDDSVIELLADTKLRELYLLQNRYTPTHEVLLPCSAKAWRNLKQRNTRVRVHLRVEGDGAGEVVLQPEAPVHSVSYQTPKTRISSAILLRMLDNYNPTLAVYAYEGLPRYSSAKSFSERNDALYLMLCRQCPTLTTLFIRERISTSTLLLIAHTARRLRQLVVRRFAVILRCDWPRHPEWSDEFYAWLRYNSRSYESVEREISQLLGYNWCLTSDANYKTLSVKSE